MTHSSTPSHVAVRRRDRAVASDAWIRHFLSHAPVGVLALPRAGAPHINSNLFVYDRAQERVVLHSARTGALREAADHASRVTFHVFEMGRLLPARRAVDFSVEYAGVTIHGDIAIVEDAAEAKRDLQTLLDKYAPSLRAGEDYEATTDADLKRTSVYAISIAEWSGKRKAVASDTPGAFSYPLRSMLEPPDLAED